MFHDPEDGQNISCWEFSADEIVEILKTGKVYLHVWGRHPAVYMSPNYPFKIEQSTEG